MNADAAKFISEHTKAGQVILMKLNFFSEVEKMWLQMWLHLVQQPN